MAFTIIPGGYKQLFYAHPLDGRTYYDTIEDAFAENFYRVVTKTGPPPDNTPTEIVETNRFIGQKIVIKNAPSGEPAEYWFRDGIADADFVRCDEYEWKLINN